MQRHRNHTCTNGNTKMPSNSKQIVSYQTDNKRRTRLEPHCPSTINHTSHMHRTPSSEHAHQSSGRLTPELRGIDARLLQAQQHRVQLHLLGNKQERKSNATVSTARIHASRCPKQLLNSWATNAQPVTLTRNSETFARAALRQPGPGTS